MIVRSPEAPSVSLVRRGRAELRQWLLGATVLAAGTELLILRVFTRTAIHIPGFADLRIVYVPISEVGRSAYYLAVVLLMVTLVVLVEDLHRRREIAARTGAAGITLFLVVAIIARAGAADAQTLDLATLAAVLLLAPWALGGRHGRSRFPIALLVTAFAVSGFGAAQQRLAGSGGMLGDDTWFALGGEVLALGAAIAAPLLVRPARNRSALVWGAVVGVTTYAGLLVHASTVKILMLWNFGLAGYLPSLLYGVAAGAATYAIIALRASGRRTTALGLAFVFIGGIGMHSTYQTGLVLAGFVLLGAADTFDRDPSTPSMAMIGAPTSHSAARVEG